MWGDDMDVNTQLSSDKDCRYLSYTPARKGFTLIELIITLSVITILIAIIPSVSATLINSNKVTIALNSIASDMALARTEAIKRNENVQLCKSTDGENCLRASQWESGWIVFVDKNKNRWREETEQILVYRPAFDTISIVYRGSGSSHYIRYRSDGATGVNGTFALCSDSHGLYKKALILFRTGRLRLSNTRSGGVAISCS